MLSDMKYITFVVVRDVNHKVHIVQYNNPYPEELTKALASQGASLLSHASLDLTHKANLPLKEVIDDLFEALSMADVRNFITTLFAIWFTYGTEQYETIHTAFAKNPAAKIQVPAVTDVPVENMTVYYGVKTLENYEEFEKLIVRTGVQAALAANYNKFKFAKN